jgi:hypothetical protein
VLEELMTEVYKEPAGGKDTGMSARRKAEDERAMVPLPVQFLAAWIGPQAVQVRVLVAESPHRFFGQIEGGGLVRWILDTLWCIYVYAHQHRAR